MDFTLVWAGMPSRACFRTKTALGVGGQLCSVFEKQYFLNNF